MCGQLWDWNQRKLVTFSNTARCLKAEWQQFASKKWRLSYVTLISKIWRLADFSAHVQLANWDVFKSKLKYIILWMSELFTLSPLNRENKEMSNNILYLFLPYELFDLNFTKWSKVFDSTFQRLNSCCSMTTEGDSM